MSMMVDLSPTIIFLLGAFLGALAGRTIVFFLMALGFLFLILST
jgi:hypothetical protein